MYMCTCFHAGVHAHKDGYGLLQPITAYYSHPLHVLGSRSVRNPSSVILKINLGILSCLPSPTENFRPV